MTPIQRGIETYKSNLNSQNKRGSYAHDRIDLLDRSPKKVSVEKNKKSFSEVLKKKMGSN
jgi:hypothetical protein